MSFPNVEVPGVPPGFDKTWQRVHVRNTFIEVDEEPHSDLTLSGLDLHNAPGRTWRRGHLRCASEPMSFFLSQPPWEPVSLNTPPFSMPSGALPTGDSRGERGRPCPHRSLNQMTQMTQMTIQESLEEYEERESLRNSLPQYVGMKSAELRGQNTGEQGTAQSAWCGEPWLVDVTTSPGFLEHREEEGRSSPEWSAPSVPTLALPLRFRHARQRSRTIQEDTELDALDALDAPKVHPGLPWNSLGERVNGVNVRVRNTFIEVDEGSDGCTDPSVLSARPAWRPGHLRCASEPIPSYPAESRIHSGFHSRSSSYQDDDVAEILQAQLGQSHDDPHLGQNSHGDVFPFVHSQHGSVGNVGNDTQNPDSHASPDQIHEQRGLHPAVSPLSQDLAQTSPAEHHGNSPPAKTSLCKWHSRGTCKYGDSCRFSHSKNVKSTKSKSETLRAPASTGPQAPLPAGRISQWRMMNDDEGHPWAVNVPGLVPGVGAPFPVGAVSPEALTTLLECTHTHHHLEIWQWFDICTYIVIHDHCLSSNRGARLMCVWYLECDKFDDFCLSLLSNFRHPSPNQQGCSPKSDSHLSWNLVFSVVSSPKSLTARCAKANSRVCVRPVRGKNPQPVAIAGVFEPQGKSTAFSQERCLVLHLDDSVLGPVLGACLGAWGVAGAWCHGWIILVQLQVHERFGTMIAWKIKSAKKKRRLNRFLIHTC